MSPSTDLLAAARAQALFTSYLSAGCPPTRVEVQTAIREAVRAHGGTRGCAAAVAAAYGEYPETAAPRMRWARGVVTALYATRPCPASGLILTSTTAAPDDPRPTHGHHAIHAERRQSACSAGEEPGAAGDGTLIARVLA